MTHRPAKRLAFPLLVCLALLTASGCGSSSVAPETPETALSRDLENVGEMYRMFSIANNRPPKDFAELSAAGAGLTGGLTQVNENTVVVYFGATLPSLIEEPGNPPSDKVLAYEKQVPESGGSVLMLDRTVKRVTADEFKAMPKAGSEPPADAAKKAG